MLTEQEIKEIENASEKDKYRLFFEKIKEKSVGELIDFIRLLERENKEIYDIAMLEEYICIAVNHYV